MITGEYNKNGYQIFSDNEEIYSATNNPHASQGPVVSDGVPLVTLRKWCRQTAKEFAKERHEEISLPVEYAHLQPVCSGGYDE